jgi:hypothetical protein
LNLLLILFGGLEILAGLLALISPAPVVSLQLEVPVVWIAAVLTRLFGAEVFSLGLACLKARDEVQSLAGLAVSIRTRPTTRWQPWLLSGLQQGRAWAACCCGERGLSIRFSAC